MAKFLVKYKETRQYQIEVIIEASSAEEALKLGKEDPMIGDNYEEIELDVLGQTAGTARIYEEG